MAGAELLGTVAELLGCAAELYTSAGHSSALLHLSAELYCWSAELYWWSAELYSRSAEHVQSAGWLRTTARSVLTPVPPTAEPITRPPSCKIVFELKTIFLEVPLLSAVVARTLY